MSSSPTEQTMEVIKAIRQQLHLIITPMYSLPKSRKEVYFPSRAAASSKTLLIKYLVSLLSLQPIPVIWLFSLKIQLCLNYSHFQKGKKNNFSILYLPVVNCSCILPLIVRPLKRIGCNHSLLTFSGESNHPVVCSSTSPATSSLLHQWIIPWCLPYLIFVLRTLNSHRVFYLFCFCCV